MTENQNKGRVPNTTPKPEDSLLPQLALMMGLGRGAIEAQEAQGQADLIKSVSFPTNGDQDDILEQLGFKLGEPYADDPLFRDVEMPKGWKKSATGHAMHSHVLDETGAERIGIFYKAAFYDRKAQYHVKRRFQSGCDYDNKEINDNTHVQYVIKDAKRGGEIRFKTEIIEVGERTEANRTEYWASYDKAEKDHRAACDAWFAENYPDHEDLVKSWAAE